MSDRILTESLIARAAKEFQKCYVAGDDAAPSAFFWFLEQAANPIASAAQINAFLDDPEQVERSVAYFKTLFGQEKGVSNEQLIQMTSVHLTEIARGMKQSLTGQQQIQDDIVRLNAVATRLEAASARNEVASKELAESQSKVLSNTSVKAAFLLGLSVSTLTNFGTGYLFDRYLSVDAINRRNRQDDVPALQLPELVPPWPPTPPDGSNILAWFTQSGSYTLMPAPRSFTTLSRPEAASSPAKDKLLRHQR